MNVGKKGGEGGIDMAKRVVELVEGANQHLNSVYELPDSIEDKMVKRSHYLRV